MGKLVQIKDEVIISKIYEIRGQKVMLDRDLAELFGVETRALKQAVRRNLKRFPTDFMFELTKEEFDNLRSQIVTSKSGGTRYMPMAFTEQGVTMLSCVLNSDLAIEMNIRIIRIFVKMREMFLMHKDLIIKLNEIEQSIASHDEHIAILFEYIEGLMSQEDQKKAQNNRKRIGFKKS